MGHLGYDQTLELIKERFFWPMMYDIEYFVNKICKCIKDRARNTLLHPPLKTITSTSHMELIGLDLLHLDACTDGFQYLLVITDHITRYTQVCSTRKKEIKITSAKLFDDYILRFGTAGKILPEQGRKFENKSFTHLSKLCNMVEMDMIKLIVNMIDMDDHRHETVYQYSGNGCDHWADYQHGGWRG